MSLAVVIPFGDLRQADLVVDAVYEGGKLGHSGDEPISQLLSLKVSGGVRYRGSAGAPSLVALVSSGRDMDWPDHLDDETGVYTYYGDNKRPGQGLHETPILGNEVLRTLFEGATTPEGRYTVPPIFVFRSTGERRNHQYLGLAVPGVRGTSSLEDLVAVWRSTDRQRYQNYRALFTILDVGVVRREWIEQILAGAPHVNAPTAWEEWVRTGVPRPLIASRTQPTRSRLEQTPLKGIQEDMLAAIWSYYTDRPHAFEYFAAELVRLYLHNVASIEVTRPTRDGGRDAVGKYRVGAGASAIDIDFAVEAKCYSPGKGVGVRELSRLLSRLRHRQFGVLVTTSHLDRQAYAELKEDGHPIIVLSGRDIAEILIQRGVTADEGIRKYLHSLERE